MTANNCLHANCSCDGKPELQGYCGPECREQGRTGAAVSSCSCGHPGCEGQAVSAAGRS
jgi:hypothetical protein